MNVNEIINSPGFQKAIIKTIRNVIFFIALPCVGVGVVIGWLIWG